MTAALERKALLEWSPDGGRARVFSGHESFTVRHGWLPKLYEASSEDAQLFSSDERAILRLGLGRNMVKSLRFWGEAFGLTRSGREGTTPTLFARRLLDPATGLDPYLEDPASLWRLHWRISAHAGLGAWVAVFQELSDPEITRERLVEKVRARAITARGPITENTASTHVDILLRTYATVPDTAPEEVLGCPFQELGLLTVGTSGGKPVVRLTRGPRRDVDSRALAFAAHDFWSGMAPHDRTLSVRSLLLDRRGLGAIFRMDEVSFVEALDELCSRVDGLKLSEDGAGGLNLVLTGPTLDVLENHAWRK